MDEKTKQMMRERRQNQPLILHSSMANIATGEILQTSSVDIKTNIKTIHFEHPKFKKWKEDLKRNPRAKMDETIKG